MKKSLFIYCLPSGGFSGQVAATELIIKGFIERRIPVHRLHPPAIDRTSGRHSFLSYVIYLYRLLYCWFNALLLSCKEFHAVHLTLGQTKMAMLRDGIALTLVSILQNHSIRTVVALNGSIFLDWSKDSTEGKLFCWVIRKCTYVTCLGSRHQKALIGLGIPAEKIQVVYNVCEYESISEEMVREKQSCGAELNILLLSSLIDTKGFPEYVEAIELLSKKPGPSFNAVLCGPITITPYSERFATKTEAQEWIHSKLEAINQTSRVKINWIPGADGEAKSQLYKKAHIFVLPTRYKVEAQPLAVIEALAWGATVITSRIGELPSTVDSSCAIALDDPSTEQLVNSIELLLNQPDLRCSLALGGLARFSERFDRNVYLDNWVELMGVS